jgi:hypothetical protein
MKLITLSACAAIFLQLGCSKDNGNPNDATGPLDIYVTGEKNGQVTYWKNGEMQFDSPNPSQYYIPGKCYGITVSNGDVYVAGRIDSKATYWKNGISYTLTDFQTTGFAVDVMMLDNDLYVAGANYGANGKWQAGYWKNGHFVALTEASIAQCNSITSENKDVYAAGEIIKGSAGPLAVYWKNGDSVTLGPPGSGCTATSIDVEAGDVYVAGEYNGHPVYWKNGNRIHLESSSAPGFGIAKSILVSENDIHIVGYVFENNREVPVYWKNGVKTVLQDTRSVATDIAIVGNDVYISGYSKGEIQEAVYWKNGIKTVVDTDSSAYFSFEGNGIAVSPRK